MKTVAQRPPAPGISSLPSLVAPQLDGHRPWIIQSTSTLGGHHVRRHRRSRHRDQREVRTLVFEDAVKTGIARAEATLRGVKSAWIKEQVVDVENGGVVAYRVNMLVTFVLE